MFVAFSFPPGLHPCLRTNTPLLSDGHSVSTGPQDDRGRLFGARRVPRCWLWKRVCVHPSVPDSVRRETVGGPQKIRKIGQEIERRFWHIGGMTLPFLSTL